MRSSVSRWLLDNGYMRRYFMEGLSEQEMLKELKAYDTPAITNVVATYPEHPLCLGLYNPWTENWYTDQSIRCM